MHHLFEGSSNGNVKEEKKKSLTKENYKISTKEQRNKERKNVSK